MDEFKCQWSTKREPCHINVQHGHLSHNGAVVFPRPPAPKTFTQADLDRAVAKAVEDALGKVVLETSSISTLGAGEYARGFDQAMRLVEGIIGSFRARVTKP